MAALYKITGYRGPGYVQVQGLDKGVDKGVDEGVVKVVTLLPWLELSR